MRWIGDGSQIARVPAPQLRSSVKTTAIVDVAISIVCHDDRRALHRCLPSLPAACAGIRWTATVVQNVPGPDHTDLDARFPWVRTVRNVVPGGFAANHNQVLQPVVDRGSARYVLVLNDDTELAPGCVSALVNYGDNHPDVGVIGPATTWPDGTPQPSYYSFPTIARSLRSAIRPARLSCQPMIRGRGWLVGACLLLRCEALRQVGLFDRDYFLFYEDIDLARRLWGAGWASALCSSASIVHSAHETVSRSDMSLVMEHQMIRSQYLYFKRYRSRFAVSLLATLAPAAFLARAAIAQVQAIVTGDRSHRDLARRLLSFANYRPTTPLPHEIIASGEAPE